MTYLRLGILLFLLISCKSTMSQPKEVVINLASVLDEDICTISINDVEYFKDVKIITDRSLGIDLQNHIILKNPDTQLHFKMSFVGKIVPDIPEIDNKRIMEIDTVLKLEDTRFMILTARMEEIEFLRSKKKIPLD